MRTTSMPAVPKKAPATVRTLGLILLAGLGALSMPLSAAELKLRVLETTR